MAGVALAGAKHRSWPLGLVGRVGIVLGLKADGRAALVADTLLAGNSPIQEIAGIDLNAGFVCIDLEAYAA